MSADNGTYILKSKDSYRVVYAHAIENLFFCYLDQNEDSHAIVPTRALEIFGACKYTRDEKMAQAIAKKMEEKTPTEYGIRMFVTPKSWKTLVREAKALAKKELMYFQKQKGLNPVQQYAVKNLQKI